MTNLDRGTNSLTRRQVLQAGLGGALAISGGTLLAGCGGTGTGSASGVSSGGVSSGGVSSAAVRRGGTLTVGMITAGTGETLNVATGFTLPDLARSYQLYEGLYALTNDKQIVPALAESGEHDSTGKVWTFQLRDGVVFHNGKPLTADDVLYTIRTWATSASYFNPVMAPIIDFPALRKRDGRTVEVTLKLPVAEFPSLLTYYTGSIIPDGFKDFKHPVGTGPFKFESFVPGTQSVFLANRDYWVTGKPYMDKLVINSSFANDGSRVNALLGGQIDIAPQFPYQQAKQYAAGSQVRVSTALGPQCQMFYLRVDAGPGKDPRVREAFRLLTNRKEMQDVVLLGYGAQGNDIPGYGLPHFADSLQRPYDVEQAKSLLKAAGQENLHIQLKTSPITAGFVDSATLLKQQAALAGVTINIDTVDPTVFYTAAGGYLSNTFSQDYWTLIPSLTSFYMQALITHGPYNVTHWGSPSADRVLLDAVGAINASDAQQRWSAVQELQFNEGGYIIWDVEPFIDGYGLSVQGVSATPAGFANNYDFKSAWLSA
jgi:peptide/nickel transport system substrate-binding protein